jgi:glycosyltransferase involved in cell wall biosynthesis
MTIRLADSRLILFFTRGISLRTWDRVGMLEREVEIYRKLLPHLGGIAFLTYGDESELRYGPRLDGIEILCNRWGLPTRLYACVAPLLYWPQMREAGIFKTNQINGSEVALFAKRLFHKKLIARCGYMWSILAQSKAQRTNSPELKRATEMEREVFTSADQVVVTTRLMKQYVIQRYNLPDAKVRVIPNYVLTDIFVPKHTVSQNGRCLIFIGRLSEEKNPLGLLEAIRGLAVELVMIGGGPQRPMLEEEAGKNGLRVQWLGNRPHLELPRYLQAADIFVLPSPCEGHPKTLLEAMASGLPVIGTDVPGIRELIRHRETGYLCGTSSEEIRAAIQDVLADADLRARMGRNAREFVVEHFALERVIEMELELLEFLVSST